MEALEYGELYEGPQENNKWRLWRPTEDGSVHAREIEWPSMALKIPHGHVGNWNDQWCELTVRGWDETHASLKFKAWFFHDG